MRIYRGFEEVGLAPRDVSRDKRGGGGMPGSSGATAARPVPAVWKPGSVHNRLASLVPFPASVLPRPGSLALGPRTSVTAGPGAVQAAAAVRRVLVSLPWPDGSRQLTGQPDDQSGQQITVDTDPARPQKG